MWREGDQFNGYDNSKLELLIYTARSREDQRKFTAGLVTDDNQFINSFWDTFVCLACTAVDAGLGPEYSPPFPGHL